jgi:PhzF family phenazine biosynthesis protein
MTLFQIDAFTDRLFGGNPAAIVPLRQWIDDTLMQQLAMENNLAETAFFVPSSNGKSGEYDIRWFTPESEINLCGHATLASAWVLFNKLASTADAITFHSKSGPLYVTRMKDMIFLDFPSWPPERFNEHPENLDGLLGVKEIVGVYKHRDLLVELNSEEDVKSASPDFGLIKKTGYKMIITAPGKDVDFVSRFFAPTVGIDEDPVTGSAHSQLIPFWSEKLGKTKMQAKQLSKRGGSLVVEQKGDRVLMGGKCVFYMQAEVTAG